MSASTTNHWKLGLFVVAAIVLAITSLFWVGANRLHRETLPVVCYFDESVQGLDLGAPVKMRGVTVGTVRDITFAPDQRHVEVLSDLYTDVLVRLGLVDANRPTLGQVPEDLRMYLATSGITGVKFLQADFVDPGSPVQGFDFEPSENFVPTAPSTLKSLEDAVFDITERMPALLAMLERVAVGAETAVQEANVAQVSRQLVSTLETVETTLVDSGLKYLSENTHAMLNDARGALARIDELAGKLLEREPQLDEVLASVDSLVARADSTLVELQPGETGEAVRDMATRIEGLAIEGSAVGVELAASLAVMRDALESLSALTEYLERDPGALLRGRAKDAGYPTQR